MRRLLLGAAAIAAAILIFGAGAARAQPTNNVIPLCLNASNVWVPCSIILPLPVGATVSATFNGFDSGPVQAVSGTLNAGSYSAGFSLGGLFTIPFARTNGGGGGLSEMSYRSRAGSVGQVVMRIWTKNPSGTTCTDHTAFVGSVTDDAFLVLPPFSLTPAAPAVTTGDASTYASLLPGRISFLNADTSPGKNLYVCVLTVATDTADESNVVSVILSGDLN